MSVDMPGHCHESSCFVQLVTWQHHVVVVGMHSGGGWWLNGSCGRWWLLVGKVTVDVGDTAVVRMVVVEKEIVCLLMLCMWCSWQMPFTWLSKEKDVAYVKLLCNIKGEFVSHQSLCFHV